MGSISFEIVPLMSETATSMEQKKRCTVRRCFKNFCGVESTNKEERHCEDNGKCALENLVELDPSRTVRELVKVLAASNSTVANHSKQISKSKTLDK